MNGRIANEVLARLEDPFGADALDDHRFTVTSRELVRVVTVASRIGARFEREGQTVDPVVWLSAPREVFRGACALTACLARDGFERAIVLSAQGLGFGLDADPALLDELLVSDCEDEQDDEDPDTTSEWRMIGQTAGPRHDPPIPAAVPKARQRRQRSKLRTRAGEHLYSSSFVRYDAHGRVLCFIAAVVDSERAFRSRIFDRFGAIAALGAPVRQGFDQFDQIAARLVSEHVSDRLALLAATPGEPTAEGFDVLMEQRA